MYALLEFMTKDTLYKVKKVLASAWLKAQHIDHKFIEPLVAIQLQCVIGFRSWLTMNPRSLRLWTTGSSISIEQLEYEVDLKNATNCFYTHKGSLS